MQLFYLPDISETQLRVPEEESKHMVKVLRLQEGDHIHAVDGKGNLYEARITLAHPKACSIELVAHTAEHEKRPFRLHMAVAPTKNIDRFEWYLEKATEIGIDEITPIVSEHSERKVVKPERLNKILVSAMKQSLKAYLPELNELSSFKELIHTDFKGRKFIAHCNEGAKAHLKDIVHSKEDVLLLIGPEGDFSPAEVQEALDLGFEEISLGNARLRTETAGVVACHIVNLVNE